MGKRYGCAVWGCGWVASGHINAYLKHPDCAVVALGSRRAESIARKQAEFGIETAAYTDFEQLLADDRVDIVSICTPNALHAAEAIRAAQAGKHLFIEKPVAIRAEELPALCAAVAKARVRSLVGFVLRFNPLVNLQRKLVADGELGKVFLLNVDYWFGRERLGWMKEREATGGACEFLLVRRFGRADGRGERWTALLGTRGKPRAGERFDLGALRVTLVERAIEIYRDCAAHLYAERATALL